MAKLLNLLRRDNAQSWEVQDVKRSLNSIKEMAKKLKANLVIFGHTHKPYIEYYEDEILFNPGATEDGRYGLIILKDGNIQLFHKQLQL